MNIQQELDIIKKNYDKTIELVTGLHYSQKKTIRMIEYYTNSKYLNGQQDELLRDKPFFNILNAICDVENSAKDVDTKDIQITSDDNNHFLESFLLSKDVYVWMKETNFAKTLNDMRDTHTRYGSLLVKKCIRTEYDSDDTNPEKTLYIEMPEWKNVMTDQVKILGGAVVEIHYMSAVELQKMVSWDKTNVNKLIKKLKGLGSAKRIPIYEIRGDFPQSYFLEADGKPFKPKDEVDFSYQLYYLGGEPVEPGDARSFDEKLLPLYWEDDTEKVYKYLKRKPKSGRDFGVGVMEEGEEAQVWSNDAVLKQYRAMEYTTKVIGQTASKKLKGRNLLTETDDGTILETEDGKPIMALNLLPSGGLSQYGLLIGQWYDQLEKTTSAYAAQRGETPPSGTPYRLQATILQQSNSVFKTLQQEMGVFITEIIEDWVLPFLATKLTKEHILSYNFSPEELKEIDSKFAQQNANERIIQQIITGGLEKLPTQEDYDKLVENFQTVVGKTKSQRFINIPKDFYKNLKAKVTVNITGEQRNKAATLESLNNILITYASNPGLANDPVASQLLTRIIELSGAGISPISITGAIADKAAADAKAQQDPNNPAGQAPNNVRSRVNLPANIQPA